MGETISKLRRIVYGEPLSDQAIAELEEAAGQVDQALKALDGGLAATSINIEAMQALRNAKIQLSAAKSSFQQARQYGSRGTPGSYEYGVHEKESELGVHRVREAITNLKDVLRMIGAPE